MSQNAPTKKRKGQASSLSPLLHFMEGMELSVELKNGKVYRGTLKSADAYMNVVLHQVQKQPHPDKSAAISVISGAAGPYMIINNETRSALNENIHGSHQIVEELTVEEYDLVHIRGPCIRYIHFTDVGVDIPAVIKAGQNRERAAEDRYKRGKRK